MMAIKINGSGNIEQVEIKSNILTSAYSKDNFNNFIDKDSILYWNKKDTRFD